MPSRRSNSVFIKDDKANSPKSVFCSLCEEKHGRIVKLVPRLDENGIPDPDYRLCPQCTQIIPIHEAMIEVFFEPKGVITDNPYSSGVQVKAVRERRKIRTIHTEGIEPLDIPPFISNKPDTELERLVTERSGIINYINDVVVEGTDSIEEGY